MRDETGIERYAVKAAKEKGWIVHKLYNPASAGWPDRLFVTLHGHHMYVEFKAEGEQLRPLQIHRCNELANNGCEVYVIDNKRDVMRFINGELDAAFLPRTRH